MQDDDSGFKPFYGEYSDDEDGFYSLYYADCSAAETAHSLLRQLEDEMMDTEEPVDASQYFVRIPDNVKRELEHLRAANTNKDAEILAKAKYEDLHNNNN